MKMLDKLNQLNKKKYRISIGKKLIFSFLLIGSIPYLFFAAYLFAYLKPKTQGKIYNRLTNNSRYIGENIFKRLLEFKSIVNNKLLFDKTKAYKNTKLIYDFLQNNIMAENFALLDYKGNIIKSDFLSSDTVLQISDTKNILYLKGNLFYRTQKDENDIYSLKMIFPLITENKTVYYLMIKLKNTELWNNLLPLSNYKNPEIIVIDEDNNMLFSNTSKTRQNNYLNFISSNERMFFNNKDIIVDDLNKTTLAYFNIFMQGQFGGKNWRVITGYDNNYITRKIQVLLSDSIKVMIIGYLLLFLLGLIFTRKFVRPIRDIINATKKYAEGQLDFKIIPTTKDELADLSESLNKMARDIKKITVSKNHLNQVINSLHELLIVVNDNYIIKNVNKVIENTLGYEEEEVKGKHISMFFTEPVKELLRTKNLFEIMDNISKNDVIYLLNKSGEKIPININISAVYKEKFFVIAIRDITKKLQMEQQKKSLLENLQKSYDKLKEMQQQLINSEKLNSISVFSAGLAHEINNPMTFIAWDIDTLKDYYNKISSYINEIKRLVADENKVLDLNKNLNIDFIMSDFNDILKDMIEGVNRVSNIITDLKNFLHPGSQKNEKYNLSLLINETLKIVGRNINRDVKIIKQIDDTIFVDCNGQQLKQAFLNILINSFHAIERKGKIIVRTTKKNALAIVEFIDTGIGIPEEKISNIFDPLYTTKPVGQGTGMGLNITYKIIKTNNGSISAASEPGKGTTITIELPLYEDNTDIN